MHMHIARSHGEISGGGGGRSLFSLEQWSTLLEKGQNMGKLQSVWDNVYLEFY